VSLYYGLDHALAMIEAEGFEQVHGRHHDVAEYTRNRVRGLGLQLLARGNEASDTVTSVVIPEGVNAAQLLALLNSEFDTVLASGQGKLTGKIVRIGHMGIVEKADIDAAVNALSVALERQGYKRPAASNA
jgi:aspartate aminotransferase-like enzyme